MTKESEAGSLFLRI